MAANIEEKLAALPAMPLPELKSLWRKYFKEDPIRFQRDYMLRRIAYQMQVHAYGGLPKTLRNKLHRLADEGQTTIREQVRLTPGTRLMRTYKGERLIVLVLDKGFEFQGRTYQSLTAIATELMGSRTSGPRFLVCCEATMTRKPIRCAVYTRKSTEEGLDKEFNSLEAQREACEAYVKSQLHEGWMRWTQSFRQQEVRFIL